jgi:hypothetical protein
LHGGNMPPRFQLAPGTEDDVPSATAPCLLYHVYCVMKRRSAFV